ncbi:MAG: hypothetical protein K8S98_10230 [Planctomycetes bacterium]|nr:hypothetical protein [Planctomycetota bacterium]
MLVSLLLAVVVDTTLYVDATAVPPGNGSAAQPFTALQSAFDVLVGPFASKTIWVAPGNYAGPFDLHQETTSLKSTAGPATTRLDGSLGNADLLYDFEGFYLHGTFATFVSPVIVRRCVFDGTGIGGTGFFFDSAAQVSNCSFFGWDTAIQEFVLSSGGGTIENVVVGPGASPSSQGFALQGATTVRYCCASSSITGFPFGAIGCFVVGDVGFWSPSAGDFHLAPLSPCIEKGDPAQLDLDGSRIDIGAFAYDPTYAATPTIYCTPKTNSKGCAPSVSSTGTASLSGPDDFVLTTTSLLNKKNGSYIWSYAPKATPFAGGTLCIKLPLVRGTQLNTGGNPTGLDCSGSLVWPFTQSYMAQKHVVAGSIVYAQAWARDNGFAAPNNSQLSNAIVFQVAP